MTSVSLRHVAVTVFVVSALAVVPRSAPAQIGGLIKKKIASATQEQVSKATDDNVTFDDITLELTPERLGKVIAGKQAGKAIANGPNGASALRDKQQAVEAQVDQLRDKNSKVLDAWDNRWNAIRSCRDSAFSAIGERIGQSMGMAMLADPAAIQRMADISTAVQDAMAKNDTAQVRKLTEQLLGVTAPKHADSLVVDAKCGTTKDAPPVTAQITSLRAQIGQLANQVRSAEVAASKAELEKSGLNDKQLAAACERIDYYVSRNGAKGRPAGYTAVERDALKERESDLKRLCS